MSVITVAGFRIDRQRPFLPDALTPLAHGPAWALLRLDERLRYNQLCGIMVIDQFIRFEHDVLAVVYERPLHDGRLSAHPVLQQQVRRLVADEHRHRAVFAAVREALLPGVALVAPSRAVRLVERVLMSRLIDARFWLWFGFAVEESGCSLASRLTASPDSGLETCDRGYADLHAWHRADEIHHLAVDEAMAEYWHDRRPHWRRAIDAKLLAGLMLAMRTPAVGGLGVIRRLLHEHPRLEPYRDQLLLGVRTVRHCAEYQRWFASPSSCPRWHAALAQRPELAWVGRAQAVCAGEAV